MSHKRSGREDNLGLTERRFREVWESLSDAGVCDAIDGAEYARVLREWIEWYRPSDIEGWIRWRANVGPDDTGPERK